MLKKLLMIINKRKNKKKNVIFLGDIDKIGCREGI